MDSIDEQALLASKLNERQFTFANLVLSKNEHGMSDADCYVNAGYHARTKGAQETQASVLLNNPKVLRYIDLMHKKAIESTGLTLEKIDKAIEDMIVGNIADYIKTTEYRSSDGAVNYRAVLKCNLQDLPREVTAQIQELKSTRDGLVVKTYSRLDAIRLASQRLGGLTDKNELSGLGGAPIEIANKVIRVRSRKTEK